MKFTVSGKLSWEEPHPFSRHTRASPMHEGRVKLHPQWPMLHEMRNTYTSSTQNVFKESCLWPMSTWQSKRQLIQGPWEQVRSSLFCFLSQHLSQIPPLVISEKANESLGSCISQQCARFSGMKTWTGFTEPTWKDVGHSVHFAIPALRRRRQEDCWSSLACLVGEFPVS